MPDTASINARVVSLSPAAIATSVGYKFAIRSYSIRALMTFGYFANEKVAEHICLVVDRDPYKLGAREAT